jgi:hypothetical protein
MNAEYDLWFQVTVEHTQLMTGVYAIEKIMMNVILMRDIVLARMLLYDSSIEVPTRAVVKRDV